MISNLTLRRAFFAFLIQLSTPILSLGMELELLYEDETLKIKLFGLPLYDQEAEIKNSELIKINDEKTKQNQQDLEEKQLALEKILLQKKEAQESLKNKQLLLQKIRL